MGIKLHIDLGKSLGKVEGQDGLSFGGALPVHFIKSSLDKYADGHPSPKTLQEFGHNLLIDKGKMMHKHVKNKIVEKLSDIGFLKIHENDGHLSEKKGEQKHANGIKHEMKKREISVLHGVSPDKMLHYKIDTAKFKCLDGKKFISFNAINDNYCDCDDGSDEPGTSACSNGRFYCIKDKQYIKSSQVNDALCDCCDGSDEWKKNKPLGFVLPMHPVMSYAPCPFTC
eukprot:Seg659.4 transcript_id=Seg659.4/GoldUCD/mRNA.D3Y31 product="Glucosidase 2 subunit beta" protein_id=Seg659.4/GoldUCD/D3Y31